MNLRRSTLLFVLMLALPTMACGLFGLTSDGPPRNAVIVDVAANSSLQRWLEDAVVNFNESEAEVADGRIAYVNLSMVEAGTAVTQFTDDAAPTMWLPDQAVWANVLAAEGSDAFVGDCVSTAQSPLVIGMWRDVAEALGWPGLPLGWLDIGSLAADPAAWNYYSGGELGSAFRLGHTHPGLAASGTETLLAVVQAAQAKTDAVTPTDIQQPIVQASVGAFEGGVTWFSSTTDDLSATMSGRGLDYLTAGVMYESSVIQYGAGSIVAVYPLEGTFMATHPACINQNSDAEAQAAARLFRDFLLSDEGQALAVARGLRPVNGADPLGPPFTTDNGVDPDQPEVIFAPPSVDSIFAVQDLWQAARKDVNLVMALDVSGSMRGSKMDNMREAAVQFVQQMGEEDYISVIAFGTEPDVIIRHTQVGPNRQKIVNAIQQLEAYGDTTLFDAIGDGGALLVDTTLPSTANALIVLTDGQDTRSYRFNQRTAVADALASNATVFTIAYGRDADELTLSGLANEANGKFFAGDEASIAAIYEEMSAAFGGSVGVGR